MAVYLDANVLVALFVPDALTARANATMQKLADAVIVSDLAALELASTVARKVREGVLSAKDGREALANFDMWSEASSRIDVHASDIAAADAIVRRFDVNLHGMDAAHVAMVARIGAMLLTLDAKMKANAKKLGIAVL